MAHRVVIRSPEGEVLHEIPHGERTREAMIEFFEERFGRRVLSSQGRAGVRETKTLRVHDAATDELLCVCTHEELPN